MARTPSSPAPESPSRRPLSRDLIVRTALALIDERGLDALSMRTLGAALGVEAMALYRHVPGKAALLDGVVDLLLEELTADTGTQAGWREALWAQARAQRALQRRHPEAYPLLARLPAQAYLAGRGLLREALEQMTADGFTPEEAARAVRVVARFSVGFSLTRRPDGEVPADDDPDVERVLAMLRDPDEEDRMFALGVRALVDGLRPGAATPGARGSGA